MKSFKRISVFILTFAVVMSFVSAINIFYAQAATVKSYTNARFGFSVEFPRKFKQGKLPENGDGCIFTNSALKMEVTAYGSNNVMDDTTESYAETYFGDGYTIKVKDNHFYAKGKADGKIVMIKGYVGSGSVNIIMVEYSAKTSKKGTKAAKYIIKHFKAGNIDDYG